MLDVVAAVSLILAVLSFGLFAVLSVAAVRDKRSEAEAFGEEGVVDDVTKLIGGLEKLAATLAKSAPWLSALIAFIFSLTIALAAASADKLSEKIPDTPATQSSP